MTDKEDIDKILDFLKYKYGRDDKDIIELLHDTGRMSDNSYDYEMDKRAGEDL